MERKNMKLLDKGEGRLWEAYLSVIDNLLLFPQMYNLQLKNWDDWNRVEDAMFIGLLEDSMSEDNSVWQQLGLPKDWEEEYLYLWVYILGVIKNDC
jgi:hypothetical protein